MTFSRIELSDLRLGELRPVKVSLVRFGRQDHCRWVFRDRDGPEACYYKIWNPTYVRRDNVPAAIESGFYDDALVPALAGLVVHGGVCRGYVMRAGRQRAGLLDESFRNLVRERTGKTGWFLVQLSGHHVIEYRGGRSLMDLEGVYPLEMLPRLAEYHCEFENPDYEEFVHHLYHETFLRTAGARGGSAASRRRSVTVVTRVRNAFARKVARRLRNRFPRLDLIRL